MYFPWGHLRENAKNTRSYLLPLEFGGIGDKHKHKNSGVLR